MSGATAADLAGIIRSRVAFINSQLAAGVDRDGLLTRQPRALIATISSVPGLTAEHGAAISNEITAGPWSAGQKAATVATVEEVFAGGITSTGGSRPQQHCDHSHACLTLDDWQFIQDQSLSRAAKVERLAMRAWSIGITCPAESVTGDDFQAAVKLLDSSQRWPFGHIKRYLASADMLPPSVFQFAYQGVAPTWPFDHHEWDRAAYDATIKRAVS
ncbi:unnamed protein product, partial [Prorocentrum cordatum]